MTNEQLINQKKNYLCDKWQLSNLRPLLHDPVTNNYVVLVYSDKYKNDVVLKILLASTNELEALKLFNGNGCVKLLEYDSVEKSFLLEYIKPGISLKSLFSINDEEAIEITSNVIKKLHSRKLIYKAKDFRTVNQWLDLLKTFKSKKISEEHLKKAKELSENLLELKQEQYLLHGDLHHENILKSNRDNIEEWVAIDPKGVIGPLEYEVGRFIMNPIPDLLLQNKAKSIINNRIEKFCTIFGFDKQRLIDWLFVQSILSACWCENDGSEEFFNYFVKLADLMKGEISKSN